MENTSNLSDKFIHQPSISSSSTDSVNTSIDSVTTNSTDTINASIDSVTESVNNSTLKINNTVNNSNSNTTTILKARANSMSVLPSQFIHPNTSFQVGIKNNNNNNIKSQQRQRSLSFMDNRSMSLTQGVNHYNTFSNSPLAFDLSDAMYSDSNQQYSMTNSLSTNLMANSMNTNTMNTNAMNTNAMNTNAMNTNAMNTNAMNTNAMNTNAMNTNTMNTNAMNNNSSPSLLNQHSRRSFQSINSLAAHNPNSPQDFLNSFFPSSHQQNSQQQQSFLSHSQMSPFQIIDSSRQPLNPDITRRYSMNDHAIAMRRMERKTSCASDSFMASHRPNSHSHSSLPTTFSVSPFALHGMSPEMAGLDAPQSPFMIHSIYQGNSPFTTTLNATGNATTSNVISSNATTTNGNGGLVMNDLNYIHPTAPLSSFATTVPSHQNQVFIERSTRSASFSNSNPTIPEQSAYISPNLLNKEEAKGITEDDPFTSFATSALLGFVKEEEEVAASSSSKTTTRKRTQPNPADSTVLKRAKKTYQCNIDYCTRSFTKLSSLQEHALSHSADYAHAKVKPFVCPKCDQTFSRSHDLKRHSYMHDQVKPYRCERCQRGFSRRDALHRHNAAVRQGKRVQCFPTGGGGEVADPDSAAAGG